MKVLKKVLIVILIIIAIPFVIALFVKNDYAVTREIVVNKPKAVVFDYIKHIKNQSNYNAWLLADPNVKQEYVGTDGTVGFVGIWKGNSDVGEGEQEIIKIAEGSRIDTELRFKEPMESTGYAFMTTDEVDATTTRVTWGMQGRSSYPFNFMNLFMESMVGNSLQKGLDGLKKEVEKQ